jgi:hypothetical protein
MSYPASMRYSRTARMSGTAYAASIERTRRRDTSGWLIVAVVCFVLVLSVVLS